MAPATTAIMIAALMKELVYPEASGSPVPSGNKRDGESMEKCNNTSAYSPNLRYSTPSNNPKN